jgi:aminoglycoside phosphotransferase (APT) family kinase protein
VTAADANPLLAEDDPERVAGLIDAEALGRWMDAQGLPGEGLPVTFEFISGGSQNEIFEIRRGDALRCALRRPPKHPPPGRDEGILREWRIIAALGGTDVPHTEAIAVCTDTSVLGCTFYLMGYVDGWSPMNTNGWPAPFDTDLSARRGLGFELVDAIARLAKVDWRAKGLEDLGRPDGYHERQVERWLRFLDRVKTRDLPGLDVASEWLSTHKPIDFVPGIMHGDYQFANVMFAHGAPARLSAIVDWEMGTVGDPKIDLAWVVQGWPEDTSDAAGASYVDLTGMPSRSELVEHYAKQSGRQCDDMDYYVILARWKLAIVLEQGYARAVQGAGDNPKLVAFGPIVLGLMQAAAELAETSDYSG